MVLSVIIVNYRVRCFLELCLHSVQRTLAAIGTAEIIVVDNASDDGSVEALRSLFPGVLFVENRENVGFARANNQALQLATGEYVLFLNPDTILPEEFATACLDFLGARAGATAGRGIGALGVRMIDGGGRFLPESRRGFPSPWVAFSRLSGLSALFPRSRFFAGYYLGHLPADSPHPAPVLSGACMLVRRAILEEVGGFDERFFMYAEDIDLSYRIEKAGYINYYFPGVTIVHFKGESTQKDTRYIRLFYKAMSQFRRKHFNRGLPAVWNLGMEAAIGIRAGIGRLTRLIGVTKPTRSPRPGDRPAEGTAGGHPDRIGGRRLGGVDPGWRIFVTGDPEEAARVRSLLPAGAGANPNETADHVLFCEGARFSFRECIVALQAMAGRGRAKPQKQQALFHASGSHSAVGSEDRDGRGETLVF